MPVLTLEAQRQIREIGRLRMGDQELTGGEDKHGNAKKRPRKLKSFRFTTQDRALAADVARLYGGEVQAWPDMPGHWQVYTTAEEIPVLVAPNQVDQWYEQWAASGCSHRCDGEVNRITDRPCTCDPDSRKCKLTTRTWVMLPEVAALGTVRLESHGYYAGVEIPAAIQTVQEAQGKGRFFPCALAIEERERKEAGQAVKRFIVPVLRMRVALNAALSIAGQERASLAVPAPSLGVGAKSLPAPEGATKEDKLRAANAYLGSIGLDADQIAAVKADCIKDKRSWSKVANDAKDGGVVTIEQFREFYSFDVLPGHVQEPAPSITLTLDQQRDFKSLCESRGISEADAMQEAVSAGAEDAATLFRYVEDGTME